MLVGTLGPRDLPVRDVADEDVLERELRLARHGGTSCALHEFLPLERVEALLEIPTSVFSRERAEPEDLADHSRVLQQRLLLGLQRVEPRGDDALHRLGQRQVVVRCALGQHTDELLRVQRVAAGAVEQS